MQNKYLIYRVEKKKQSPMLTDHHTLQFPSKWVKFEYRSLLRLLWMQFVFIFWCIARAICVYAVPSISHFSLSLWKWSFKRFIVFVCMKWRSFYNRFLIQTVTIIVYIFLKFQLQVKMTVQKISNLTDCLIWSLQKYNTAIISASPSRDHNINIVSVISIVGVTIHVTGYRR